MATRRKLGLALLAASLLTTLAMQLLTSQPIDIQGGGDLDVQSASSTVVVSFNFDRRYAALPVGCLLGLAFFVWPTRKPPRLA